MAIGMGMMSSSALAAKRKVPFGLFGMTLEPVPATQTTATVLDAQTGLMARSGVEALRANLDWSGTEPFPGVYDWTQDDKLVLAAAEHGLSLLPIVEFTPAWAAPPKLVNPGDRLPVHPSEYGAFLTTLIGRYGPHGTLWKLYPKLRRGAIRYWQIWNEPAGYYDWLSQPWPSTYTTLLKAGYRAVHAADPGAKVVSGSVVGLHLHGTTQTPWGEAARLYQAGAGHYFDVMAINAYTNDNSAELSAAHSVKIAKIVRAVMARHGDAHKPIWVTELTWTAAQGRIPRRDYNGFAVTEAGQAARLKAYYSYVAAHPSVGIKRAFWYQWSSSYTLRNTLGDLPTFAYSGLTRWLPGAPFSPMPVLSAYRSIAAKLEGCRKSTVATSCA